MFEVNPKNPELERVSEFTIKEKTSYLRAHFKKMENVFQDESASLLREIELENKRTENHEDDNQHDYRASDSLIEIEFIYLRMHRYAAILATYSFLESSMNKLCDQIKEEKNIPISVSDLNGNGIDRQRKYLTKLAGVNFKEIESKWFNLTTLNKVRNCIMHADGNAEMVSDSTNFIKIIKSNSNLHFIEQKLIMVTSEFVDKSIDYAEDVLVHIAGHNR